MELDGPNSVIELDSSSDEEPHYQKMPKANQGFAQAYRIMQSSQKILVLALDQMVQIWIEKGLPSNDEGLKKAGLQELLDPQNKDIKDVFTNAGGLIENGNLKEKIEELGISLEEKRKEQNWDCLSGVYINTNYCIELQALEKEYLLYQIIKSYTTEETTEETDEYFTVIDSSDHEFRKEDGDNFILIDSSDHEFTDDEFSEEDDDYKRIIIKSDVDLQKALKYMPNIGTQFRSEQDVIIDVSMYNDNKNMDFWSLLYRLVLGYQPQSVNFGDRIEIKQEFLDFVDGLNFQPEIDRKPAFAMEIEEEVGLDGYSFSKGPAPKVSKTTETNQKRQRGDDGTAGAFSVTESGYSANKRPKNTKNFEFWSIPESGTRQQLEKIREYAKMETRPKAVHLQFHNLGQVFFGSPVGTTPATGFENARRSIRSSKPRNHTFSVLFTEINEILKKQNVVSINLGETSWNYTDLPLPPDDDKLDGVDSRIYANFLINLYEGGTKKYFFSEKKEFIKPFFNLQESDKERIKEALGQVQNSQGALNLKNTKGDSHTTLEFSELFEYLKMKLDVSSQLLFTHVG